MRKLLLMVSALLILALPADADGQKTIRVSTDNTDMIFQVNDKGRLYMVYLGDRLLNADDASRFGWSVYTGTDGSVSQGDTRRTWLRAERTSSSLLWR